MIDAVSIWFPPSEFLMHRLIFLDHLVLLLSLTPFSFIAVSVPPTFSLESMRLFPPFLVFWNVMIMNFVSFSVAVQVPFNIKASFSVLRFSDFFFIWFLSFHHLCLCFLGECVIVWYWISYLNTLFLNLISYFTVFYLPNRLFFFQNLLSYI